LLSTLTMDFTANTAQLKERLRRLELYGIDKSHPSEEPRREQASILVFHLADVETCDASSVDCSVSVFVSLNNSFSFLVPHKYLVKYLRSTRWAIYSDCYFSP
jgi:trans-aconitate methyltransferase